jgi:hypothetical protein
MSAARLRISERQQVLLIIPLAIGALLGIWLGVLRPQFRKRAEIERLHRQLARSPYARLSMASLVQAAEQERDGGQLLDAEWGRTIERLASFEDQRDLRESEFGRIDYKMELFKSRAELLKRSEELGIQLIPQDLGLRDALGGSDAEVRVRMLQLRAVKKLADLALDRRIQKLHAIAPLAPVTHAGADRKTVFSEYPVRVEFDVDFENLYILFQAIFEQHQIFVFRNLRIEAGPTPRAPLRVRAVMSALLFE